MTQHDADELWEEQENTGRLVTIDIGRASESLAGMIAEWYGQAPLPNARISAVVIAQRLSRFEAKPDAALEAYKAENAKHGWTGRGYAFDPFFLNLNKDGGGSIGFNEDDAHWEQDDESSRCAIYCNVSPGEMIELRDALNKAFPAPPVTPSKAADDAIKAALDEARKASDDALDQSRVSARSAS